MMQRLIDCMLRVIGRLAVRAVELPIDFPHFRFRDEVDMRPFAGTDSCRQFRGGA